MVLQGRELQAFYCYNHLTGFKLGGPTALHTRCNQEKGRADKGPPFRCGEAFVALRSDDTRIGKVVHFLCGPRGRRENATTQFAARFCRSRVSRSCADQVAASVELLVVGMEVFETGVDRIPSHHRFCGRNIIWNRGDNVGLRLAKQSRGRRLSFSVGDKAQNGP